MKKEKVARGRIVDPRHLVLLLPAPPLTRKIRKSNETRTRNEALDGVVAVPSIPYSVTLSPCYGNDTGTVSRTRARIGVGNWSFGWGWC